MAPFDLNYMPEKTGKVFARLAVAPFMSKFTLIGGTALSIQIKHRLSEDLDFIADEPEINKTSIKRNIAKNFTNYRLIKEDENYQLDFIIEGIRVTFFSAGAIMIPFEIKPLAKRFKKLNIAPPDVIAVLKLSAISQRNTFRDYYDLYFLAKYHYSLQKIIEDTKRLVPTLSPVTYTETLIYTSDIEEDSIADHLSPAEMVTKEDIAGFFTRELKKIKETL